MASPLKRVAFRIPTPPAWVLFVLWFATAICMPDLPPHRSARNSFEDFNQMMAGDICVGIRDPEEIRLCRSR
jgi:hypothetical protein